MKTSNAISAVSLSANITPVKSPRNPTSRPLEKPQVIFVDEWHQRAVAGLNDQTTSFPRVW